MFSKNTVRKIAEDKPVQSTIVKMPDRSPDPQPVDRSTISNSAVVNDVSAASSIKKSLISESFEFTGDIKSEGSLTVDGKIKGNLIVQTLLIGASGVVDGSVTADSINVEGCLSGVIECKDLIVGNRASVDGQLSYGTITIHKGGAIKGDLKRR